MNLRSRKFWLLCALELFSGLLGASAAGDRVGISLDFNSRAAPIPDDFIGFGYETAAVARPGFFSAKNGLMIQFYRTLSPHGLVRIGGNISDHALYQRYGTPTVAPQTGTTVINAAVLADLGGFLRATGWKMMWGLNLGTGTKEQAAEEAMAVSAAVGSQLQSFEIGNEVNLLPRFKGNFAAYHAAYLDYKAAIRAVLPHATFSGPDVTAVSDWAAPFANAESTDLGLLTQHYYRASARTPEATMEALLGSDRSWEARLRFLHQIGLDKSLAYRINEVNSFSGGGKPGVSDTFASALWCLDYLFLLAANGCAGVNIETDINQFSWVSHYSPIFREDSGHLRAGPCYYGMLAFAMAGRGQPLKVSLAKTEINLTVYATRDSQGDLWLAVLDKDRNHDVTAEIAIPRGYASAETFRLSAPSLESRESVTLAGREVSADGTWFLGPPERTEVGGGVLTLSVAHASAALLRLRPRAAPGRSSD